MPDKTVWTDADFQHMGWHDNAVHAIAVEPSPTHPGALLVDLDYIIEWVQPTPPATAFTFWVCPATLIFDPAWDLTADINLRSFGFDLSLNAIERSDPDERNNFEWTLDGHEFNIRLQAKGFTQYLRQPPVLAPSPRLSLDNRGGIRFEQHGY
jgi:hypothetical protein